MTDIGPFSLLVLIQDAGGATRAWAGCKPGSAATARQVRRLAFQQLRKYLDSTASGHVPRPFTVRTLAADGRDSVRTLPPSI